MGQYWYPVNLDKREFVHPHRLGSGLKLGEQFGAHPGTGTALLILTAAYREKRGGGDPDLDENWYGYDRQSQIDKYPTSPAPMDPEYQMIARRTLGRWAGDRIAIVGDYAEDDDLLAEHNASTIYDRCIAEGEEPEYEVPEGPRYKDITNDVCRVIEHELNGEYVGDGWRKFECLWDRVEPAQEDK